MNDKFEGAGRYEWPIGHSYEGQWREGRMEGNGEFVHTSGAEMKGLFKGNYFNVCGKIKIIGWKEVPQPIYE